MKKDKKKGESWRRGYQQGKQETEKAFGGCKNCYGKGYATCLEYTESLSDFGGIKSKRYKLPEMRFCSCDRGKELKRRFEEERKTN